MFSVIRKIDESALRSVLQVRRASVQTNGLGFSVIATILKNREFPFKNRGNYGPKCSGYAKPHFGCIGIFSAQLGIPQLSQHAVYAHHILPTGNAWLNPRSSGPCIPMFQTEEAYQTWSRTDGTWRQYSTASQSAAARITQEVKACQQ